MFTFDFHSAITWLRVGIALVWLVFGLLFKALDFLPRHNRIVARVVGERWAKGVTLFVAIGETALGVWMLSGHALALCVALQTAAIAFMNALELRYARDLLVSPVGMVCANTVLLSLAWYVALATA